MALTHFRALTSILLAVVQLPTGHASVALETWDETPEKFLEDDACASGDDCSTSLLHTRGLKWRSERTNPSSDPIASSIDLDLKTDAELWQRANANRNEVPEEALKDQEAINLKDFLKDGPSGLLAPRGTHVRVKLPNENFTIVGVRQERSVEFLGVPFAAPPVLDYRWRSPVRYTPPASGILETTRPKPNCLQPTSIGFAMRHPEWHSEGAWPTLAAGPSPELRPAEDCLYLNVFVPQHMLKNSMTRTLRPVFVWVPGGAGMFGGANDEQLDGRKLAIMGNMIVVVGQYRLGIFGRVWSEALRDRIRDDSMSLSMQDQRAVLVWVQNNIAALGGDPNRVGMAGESSAAWDIFRHILYPSEHALFHRAVISSSGGLYFNTYDTKREGKTRSLAEEKADSDRVFRTIAKKHGCTKGLGETIDIDCMIRIPAELMDPQLEQAGGMYDPEPMAMWEPKGAFGGKGHKVDIMMGFNRDDAGVYWGDGFDILPITADRDQFKAWTERNYAGFSGTVFKVYSDVERIERVRPEHNTSVWFRASSQAVLDQHFFCPTMAAAGVFSNMPNVNTYVYRFDQVPEDTRVRCSAINCDGTETEADFIAAGSCHGCEIPFWFQQSTLLRTRQELSLSNLMVGYLANFMRSGDPNQGSFEPMVKWPRAVAKPEVPLPAWMSWGPRTPATGQLLRLGANSNQAGLAEVEAHAMRPACAIWETFAEIESHRFSDLTVGYWMLFNLSLLTIVIACAAHLFCSATNADLEKARRKGSGSQFCGIDTSAVQQMLCGSREAPESPGSFTRHSQTPSICLGSSEPYPAEMSVSELFLQRANEEPQAVALEVPDRPADSRLKVTYGEMQEKVAVVAAVLEGAGGRQGQMMAVAVDRGVHLVVGVMAVLQVGGAWAALDLGAPEERKLRILKALRPSIALVQVGASIPETPEMCLATVQISLEGVPTLVSQQPAAINTLEFSVSQPEKMVVPAMVVFTSGSTGEPKGVLYSKEFLTHGSWFYGQLGGLGFNQRTLLKSPHIWAVIEYELFAPLVRGATLLISHPSGHKEPAYLARLLVQEGIDSWMITPRVLRVVLEELRKYNQKDTNSLRLKNCVCVGEALPADLVDDFHESFKSWGLSAQLHNLYGASEASCAIWSSLPKSHRPGELPSANAPAGQPQPHVSFYLLQRQEMPDGSKPASTAKPVPCGEVGEIFFGGVMSAGYLGRPQETAASFVEVEGIPGCLYATGDLGRLVNGQLEVLGRCDGQLNISGVRIEPGEVEAVLHRCPGVKEAVVVGAGDPALLVAFCAPLDNDTEAGKEELRSLCAKQLPVYMVPSIVIRMEKIPTLPNGKRDMVNLKAQAKEAATEFQDGNAIIMDSLGRPRKQSPEQVRWQRATWGCYCFWSFGVVVDHWMACSPEAWACETVLWAIPSWGELMLRSFGNVQDLCGFLMLGAHQDANDTPDNRTSLGRRELFAWLMHLVVFLLVPVMDFLTPWQPGYPSLEAGAVHRWYLWMYVMARIALWGMTKCHVPRFLQVPLMLLASYNAPKSGVLDICQMTPSGTIIHSLAFFLFPSYCETKTAPLGASAVREGIMEGMNADGCTCAVTGKPELLYMAIYLTLFHADPLLKQLPNMAPGLLLAVVQLSGIAGLHYSLLERAPHSGAQDNMMPPMQELYVEISLLCMIALALVLSGFVNWLVWPHIGGPKIPSTVLFIVTLLSQVTCAMFFYPMQSLEKGGFEDVTTTVLEVALCILQPALFFVAALQLSKTDEEIRRSGGRSWSSSWNGFMVENVGKSALGCYLFHYFFTPSARSVVLLGTENLDSPGTVVAWTMLVPATFVLLVGPLFQAVLTGPVVWFASRAAGSKKAAEPLGEKLRNA